jgi:hypothetical protein
MKRGCLAFIAISALLSVSCSIEEPPKPPIPRGVKTPHPGGGGDEIPGGGEGGSGADAAGLKLVTEGRFRTSDSELISLDWKAQFYYVDKEVTLGKERTAKTAFFKQTEREFLVDSYTQGAADPGQTRYLLSRSGVDVSEVRVTLGPTSLPVSAYRLDVATNELVLNSAPAVGTMIKIYYRLLGLKTDFLLSKSIDLASLVVTVNDVKSTDYKHDAATGYIRFNNPPKDGAQIKAVYVEVGQPVLKYPTYVPPELVRNLRVFWKNDPKMVLNVTYANEAVVLNPADFKEGQAVVIRYFDDATDQTLQLAYTPMADTFKLDLSGVSCTEDQFELNDKTLTTTCPITEEQIIKVSYRYIREIRRSFSMAGKMPEAAGEYVWRVWVDGEERTDFEKTANNVQFDEELPLEKDVIVRIYLKEAP